MLDRLRQLLAPADIPAQQAAEAVRPECDASRETDFALLRRYVEYGSEDAFSQIVCRHAGWIYNQCRRALRDTQLAEDATQAVFLLLARKARSMPAATHIAGWLAQTCRYVLADVRKHRARYLRRQQLARDLAVYRFQTHENALPAVESGVSEALDEAISRLREGDRQAILMHFYEGLTIHQMAEQLGIGPEGARKRLTRALARLRKRLAGAGIARRHARSLLPVGALAMLLRSRGAEAAPARVAIAAARAATIPGTASPLAEVMVEAVRLAHAAAATRVLAAINLLTPLPAIAVIGAALLLAGRGGYVPSPTPQHGNIAAVPQLQTAAARPKGVQVAAIATLSQPSKDVDLGPAEPEVFEDYQQPPEARMWPEDPEVARPTEHVQEQSPVAAADMPAEAPDDTYSAPAGIGAPRRFAAGEPGKLPAPGPKPRFAQASVEFRHSVVLLREAPREVGKHRRHGEMDSTDVAIRRPLHREGRPASSSSETVTLPEYPPVPAEDGLATTVLPQQPPDVVSNSNPLPLNPQETTNARGPDARPPMPGNDEGWSAPGRNWAGRSDQAPFEGASAQPANSGERWWSQAVPSLRMPPGAAADGRERRIPWPAGDGANDGLVWDRWRWFEQASEDAVVNLFPFDTWRGDAASGAAPWPAAWMQHRPRMSAVEIAVPEPAAALWAIAACAAASIWARRFRRRTSR